MKKILAITAFAFFLVLATGIASAGCAKEATTYVGGKIYQNSLDNGISDAQVTVICNSMFKNATSSNDGSYSVQFDDSSCSLGNIVYVNAVKDALTGSNSSLINFQQNVTVGCIDFTLNVGCVDVPLIPEFGIVIGLMTIIGAGLVFFVVRKK